jgi:hypothetical protein
LGFREIGEKLTRKQCAPERRNGPDQSKTAKFPVNREITGKIPCIRLRKNRREISSEMSANFDDGDGEKYPVWRHE